MSKTHDALINGLLFAAWEALNAAAADLALVVPLSGDDALAGDARVLAVAIEREAEAVLTTTVRWQRRTD